MSLHPSSSEATADPSRAYERLHPAVQRWIWSQGWQALRATQAQAVAPILAGTGDVIVSAATASGKTEAAWLPICSAIAFDADAGVAQPGVKALYVSPLKALINDQYLRLQDLCQFAELPVYRRHGDVTGADRTAIRGRPDGLLLITPESLEALFVTDGPRVAVMLNGLRYIVVDELHAFIGTERGAQLQSLLHRVELAIRRRVPRVALSATLADPAAAAEFLRPGGGAGVTVIGGGADQSELRLILRGYVRCEPRLAARSDDRTAPEDDEDEVDERDASDTQAIAENLYKTMRGKDNLVFANSRRGVEIYTDLLTRMCDERRVPNEFFAHHGNLSKEHREDVEKKLKSREASATAICTSTLEMGIDIGSADAVGQIGPPASVSALRQRVGRSGRRGSPATLRMYVAEAELTERSALVDQLRARTVQAIAVVELLLAKWYEPPNTASLHLSTLIQQLLSVIAQHGGATAAQLYSALCAHGPFIHVTREMFLRLLRDLGERDIIAQASDGTLLAGGLGDRIVNHYSFYAAFQTPEEFRLVCAGRTLGTIPVDEPLMVDGFLLFGGRRWRVVSIDASAKVVEVARAKGGRPPMFGGRGPGVADGIRRKMRSIYEGVEVPAYLDATGRTLLQQGRDAYARLGLDDSPIHESGSDILLIPWRGDLIMNTLAVVLTREGIAVAHQGVALECQDATRDQVRALLTRLASAPEPDPLALASGVPVKEQEKYDGLLGPELLTATYAARSLDIEAAWGAIRDIAEASATA